MKLSTLITKANEVFEKHGDLIVGIEMFKGEDFVDASHAFDLRVDGEVVLVSNCKKADK